ncbi:hypothetical protein Vadar_022204 [Vaccinium darrowii]|uniref:Uncharacterized protein n=1 Tax=Vaccinium darrowii TaxID=229202 RepID=A0ACB7YYH2_9ERIC|nr:hypothetical protein Vadar_022204 [Vaccinium darrowii]
MPFQNLVVFSDVKSGDGIEASVTLKVEDLAKFEVDDDFLAFVVVRGQYLEGAGDLWSMAVVVVVLPVTDWDNL